MNTVELIEKPEVQLRCGIGDLFQADGRYYQLVQRSANATEALLVNIATGYVAYSATANTLAEIVSNVIDCGWSYLGPCKITVTPEGGNG